MTSNQDARPFVDLRKDAEEFRSKFDADILKCISFLDTKITTLICDPDSLGTPSRGVKQNALVEFSKAKYDIFINVKSLINEMEREWLKYISEMKKLFIENVEIFLAGTKLEVKLPSDEFQSSPSFKKSPRKTNPASSITSTLYPIINTFTKNVAAFGSPLRSKDDAAVQNRQSKDLQLRNDNEISDDESDSEEEAARILMQSKIPSGKGRATVMLKRHVMESKRVSSPKVVEMETDEDESDLFYDNEKIDLKKPMSRSTPRGRDEKKRSLSSSDLDISGSSSKVTSRSRKDKSFSLSDIDTSLSSSRGTRSRSENETGLNTSEKRTQSPNKTQKENKDRKQDLETSQSSSRRSSRSMVDRESSGSQVKQTESPDKSQNENKDRKQVLNTPQLDSNKKRGRPRRGEHLNKSPVLREKSPNILCSEDSDKEKESDVSRLNIRGRKGKQTIKNTPKKTLALKNTPKKAQETLNKSSKSEETSENESKSEENLSRLRGNKKKQPVKKSPKKSQRTKKKSLETEQTSENESTPRKGSTDESETEQNIDQSRSVLKARRGGTPAKHNLNYSTVSKNAPKTQTSEDTETDLSEAEQKKPAARTALATRTTPARGGKRAIQDKNPKQPSSPKKSNLTSSSDSSESGVPRSPKKVTFTESDINDNLDVYSPDARISKPTPRRKTLLPPLDTLKMLQATESPRVGRANAKRKTIAGTSDLARISPPKRLKVSESKRVESSSQVEDAADDNLLESDGNYSEWIPLMNIGGKIPTSPAVYEMKVWRAKKTAFIGSAESLRQKLTLYKLRQNSGHKHLDKFIERNVHDIQIRYEVVSSVNSAKNEVEKRLKSFLAQFKTTPAFNTEMIK